MIRVAINGYGRIGRVAHRVILERFATDAEIVAINAGSSTDITGWMYLLKYDTAYGPIQTIDISAEKGGETPQIGWLVIGGKKISVYCEKDPSKLPWAAHQVDVVLEATGKFKKQAELQQHIAAGAKAVVLASPAKDETTTYVISINEKDYKGETTISNASCTTNCIAPVAKIMHDHFGIERAMMTTVHAYTSDQRLQDGGHKDYRRARAAAQNIIPTTTGATNAAAKAMPELSGIFGGLAVRVPVTVGSLSDFTFLTKKNTTKEEINSVFTQESNASYKGIVAVTEEPFVSSDIIANPHSAVVDLALTNVVGENFVKIIAWYDNEYGYSNRLVEEVLMVGRKLSGK